MLAAASTVTGALVMGVTTTRIADIGPADARLWWTMFLMSFGGMLLGLLLLIGATAVVSLESRLFPRWFAAVSVVLALVSIVGAFTIGYATTGIQATAGIAVILDSVWIFLVSLFVWRDRTLALRGGRPPSRGVLGAGANGRAGGRSPLLPGPLGCDPIGRED